MGALRTLLTAALGKRALARAVILLAILAASAAFSQVAYAATEVKSNITTNTTWTTAGSPYILEQQVKVVSGVTLTIQPGVTVEFNGSDLLTFYIDGTLRAIGTESNPITFTSSQGAAGAGAPGQYEGVALIGKTASAQLSFTHFEYGGTGSGGYYAYAVLTAQSGANLEVEYSIFEHNKYSGLRLNDVNSAIVSHSIFAYNGDGIAQGGTPPGPFLLSHSFIDYNQEYGLFFNWLESSTSPGADLENNEITRNGKRGLYLEGYCSSPVSTFPHGNGNDIYANGPNTEEPTDGSELGMLYHCEALPVDWTGNYWGAAEFTVGPVPLLNGAFVCDGIPADYYQVANSLQSGGYLAYSDSDPAEPAPGPISTSSYTTFEPILCEEDGHTTLEYKTYRHLYNSFYLAPGEISSEYIPIL